MGITFLVAEEWRVGDRFLCQKVGSAEDYASCSGITDTTGEGIFFTKEQRPLTFFSHPMCSTGVSGPYTWQAPSSEGNHYFVCGIGIHCSVGNMKAAIEVSNNCWGAGPSCYYLTNKSLHIYRHRVDAEIVAYFGDYRISCLLSSISSGGTLKHWCCLCRHRFSDGIRVAGVLVQKRERKGVGECQERKVTLDSRVMAFKRFIHLLSTFFPSSKSLLHTSGH